MDIEALKQLKQVFYSQNFFTRYIDYLANRDFNNLSLGQNKALDVALTDSKGKRYYGRFFAKNSYLANKGVYSKHSINISERQAWASVEEFLDIIDNEAVDELNELCNYLIDLFKYIQSDYPKNSAETKQKSEDTIIRLIVKHFWRENPLRYIERDFKTPIYCPDNGKIVIVEENNAKQKVKNLIKDEKVKNATDVNGDLFIIRPFEHAPEILDRATFDVLIKTTKERLIDESLDDNFRQVIKYLQAVKKIRNNQAHNIGNTVEQGASSVFEFCLFVYLHLVLTLRQSLIRRGGEEYRSDNHAEFFVEIEKPSPSLTIKLFRLDDNDEVEIKPIVKEDRKLVFNVDYYVKYKLIVNDRREIETEFIYNSFTPHTTIHDLGDPIIYHCDEDSTLEKPVLFRGLLNEMENLEKKFEENTEALIETSKALDKNTTATEKAAEAAGRAAIAAENVGEKLVIIGETISNRFDEQREAEEGERERRKKDEEVRRQKEEEEKKAIEKKRRSRLFLFGGCVTALLIASVGIFIWCLFDDNSLLWLQHKTSVLCVTSFVVLAFVFAVYKWYKSSKNQKTKKLAISIGVILLFVLLFGGSYIAIPYKTAKDFVAKYDFSTHEKNENANAVAVFAKSLDDDDVCDIATSKLIEYYINYEKDSTNINKAIELSDKVIGNITKYPKSSTYAAYAYFAKARFGVDTKLYAPINYIFDNSNTLSTELICLKGIMTVYGLGVEKNVEKGIAMLQESANRGNPKAQYYLGFVYSRDLTDWDAYRKGKNILPFNNINLYWAIYYLKEAAKNRPEAMLELANIYSDLNLTGKASAYYKMTIDNSDGEILKSAYFKMGLLQERLGNEHNEFLTKAIESAYGPAILYKAKKEKDHVKLIGYYLSTSQSQKTYIPPIVFDYLYEAEFDNALKTLQTAHVNGGFDMNFINGMKYLLGITVNKDSIIGNEYMKKSANNGCVFAKMMWEFRKQESNPQFQFSCFNEYCNEIPFAHVLRSWLLAKRGDMFQAQPEAMKAISLGHPAGAYMLKYTEYKGFKLLDKWQMAFRALPNTMNKQDCVNFGFYYDYIFYFHLNQRPIPSELLEFWEEIAIENHCFDAECWILGCLEMSNEKLSDDNYRRLLEAALVDANGMVPPSTLTFIAYKINEIPSFNEQLKLKYQYEPHIQEILSITPESRYYQVEAKTGKPSLWLQDLEKKMDLQYITDWQILNELSDTGNNYLDYYPM